MPRRNRPLESSQFEVVYLSARRCCVCFAVDADFAEKKGQIAHLDQDRSNNALENLAWLCLHHHDAYDSRTSQSKGYSEGELKRYRQKLHDEVNSWRERRAIGESKDITHFKQTLIEQNLALFFFAAHAMFTPEMRAFLIKEISDPDFKEQLLSAWAFLDRPCPDDEAASGVSHGSSRLDKMATYIASSDDGKDDLQLLMGLAGSVISSMDETDRNAALFEIKDDTIRSGLLLLHKIRLSMRSGNESE